MTDNTQFKEDASKLLNSLIKFNRTYMLSSKSGTPANDFEREPRQMLKIARTDEENQQQHTIDCQC